MIKIMLWCARYVGSYPWDQDTDPLIRVLPRCPKEMKRSLAELKKMEKRPLAARDQHLLSSSEAVPKRNPVPRESLGEATMVTEC